MTSRLKLFVLFCTITLVYADQSLEAQLEEIKQSAPSVKFPEVPVYDVSIQKYLRYPAINSFSSEQLNDHNYSTQITNDFNLNQVEMVGYMQDNNVKYGLIKTPYETLMLKAGDKIKGGVLTSVNESGAVITELVVDSDGKTYNKIVNLKYNINNEVKLKLQWKNK